jgi:hypothetical protein
MQHATVVMMRRGVLMLAVGVCLAATAASAQPSLNLKRVVSNWPTIEVYFTVACDGAPRYFTDPTWFRMFENGQEVDDFTLWCADGMGWCPPSVALVFDASGSMSGARQAAAIAGGNAFIDMMDDMADEAAILWVSEKVTMAQRMTSSKMFLYQTLRSLPANGIAVMWDGIYEGCRR